MIISIAKEQKNNARNPYLKDQFEVKLPGAGALQIGYGSSSPPSIGDPVGPSNISIPGIGMVTGVVVVAVVVVVVVVVGVVGGGVGCS